MLIFLKYGIKNNRKKEIKLFTEVTFIEMKKYLTIRSEKEIFTIIVLWTLWITIHQNLFVRNVFEFQKHNEQVRKKWAIEKRALLMQNKHQEG